MKKKSLIMLLCALITVSSIATGTIAYLTARSSVANTFTVGNVVITVDETKVNENGQPLDEDGNVVDPTDPNAKEPVRNDPGVGNDYHLVPGQTYVKDPTVTVNAMSESCYVRVKVTVNCAAELDALCKELNTKYPEKYPFGLPQDHVAGYDAANWVYTSTTADTDANTVTYEFRYYDAANATDIVTPVGADPFVTDALFDSITVPGELTGEQLATIGSLKIDVQGEAIQSAVFENADAAWAAFDAQNNPVTNP